MSNIFNTKNIKQAVLLAGTLLIGTSNLCSHSWAKVTQGLIQTSLANSGKITFSYDDNGQVKEKKLYVLEYDGAYISYATESYCYTNPAKYDSHMTKPRADSNYKFGQYTQKHRHLDSASCVYRFAHTPSQTTTIITQEASWYLKRDLIISYGMENNTLLPVKIILLEHGSAESPINSLFTAKVIASENRIYKSNYIYKRELKDSDAVTKSRESFRQDLQGNNMNINYFDRHGERTGNARVVIGKETPGTRNRCTFTTKNAAQKAWVIEEQFHDNTTMTTYSESEEIVWKAKSHFYYCEKLLTKEVEFLNKNDICIGSIQVKYNATHNPMQVVYSVDDDYFESVKHLVVAELNLLGEQFNLHSDSDVPPTQAKQVITPYTLFEHDYLKKRNQAEMQARSQAAAAITTAES